MSDLNWFRLLFTVSTLVWLAAGLYFGSVYLATWYRERKMMPFIAANVFIAASNLAESLLYWIVVFEFPTDPNAARVAIYYIPAGIILRAVAFSVCAWFVMYRTRPDGGYGDLTRKR